MRGPRWICSYTKTTHEAGCRREFLAGLRNGKHMPLARKPINPWGIGRSWVMNRLRSLLGVPLGMVLVAACSSSSSTGGNPPSNPGRGAAVAVAHRAVQLRSARAPVERCEPAARDAGRRLRAHGRSCLPQWSALLHQHFDHGNHVRRDVFAPQHHRRLHGSQRLQGSGSPKVLRLAPPAASAAKGRPMRAEGGGADIPAAAGVQCVATCPMSDSFLFCATNADCPTGRPATWYRPLSCSAARRPMAVDG